MEVTMSNGTHHLRQSAIDGAMSGLASDLLDFSTPNTYMLVREFLSDADVPNDVDDMEYALRMGQGYVNGIISSMRAPVGKKPGIVKTQQRRKYGQVMRQAGVSIGMDAFSKGFDDGIKAISSYDRKAKTPTHDLTLTCVLSALLSLCGNEFILVDVTDDDDADGVVKDAMILARRVTDEQYGTVVDDGLTGVGAGVGNMMGVSTNSLHQALIDVMPLVVRYVRERCLPITTICKPGRADVTMWGMLYCVGAVTMRLVLMGAIDDESLSAHSNDLGKRVLKRTLTFQGEDGEDLKNVTMALTYCYSKDDITHHAVQYDESIFDGIVDVLHETGKEI